jgi:transposase
VTETGDGRTVVDVVTAPEEERARRCLGCGTAAATVKDRVTTAPRNVRLGDRQVLLRWHKTCWFCDSQDCERDFHRVAAGRACPRPAAHPPGQMRRR